MSPTAGTGPPLAAKKHLRAPSPQSAGELASQTANRKACLAVSVCGSVSGSERIGGGSARHIRSDQSSAVPPGPGEMKAWATTWPGTQARRDDTAVVVVLLYPYLPAVSGQASRAVREFWTEFAWAKGARATRIPSGRSGRCWASEPPRDGGMEMAWQACLGLGGRMGDVALRVASLGGFEPGDLELGSQRDHRHKHNTRRSRAYLAVRCEACDKLQRRE